MRVVYSKQLAGGEQGADRVLEAVAERVALGDCSVVCSAAGAGIERLRAETVRPMRVPGLIGGTGPSGFFGATGDCGVVLRVVGSGQVAGGERGADGVLKAVAGRVAEGEYSVERSAAGAGTERFRATTARPMRAPGLIGDTEALGLFGATEVSGLFGATGIRGVLSHIVGSMCLSTVFRGLAGGAALRKRGGVGLRGGVWCATNDW